MDGNDFDFYDDEEEEEEDARVGDDDVEEEEEKEAHVPARANGPISEQTVEQVAKRMRTWKIKLIKQLKDSGKRVVLEDALALAEQICPSSQKLGGQLFLNWFWENGKKVNWEAAKKEEGLWPAHLRQSILEHDGIRWLMSIICSTNNISQKNTLQLFFPTLVLEW